MKVNFTFLLLIVFGLFFQTGCTQTQTERPKIDAEGTYSRRPIVTSFAVEPRSDGSLDVGLNGSGFRNGASVLIKEIHCSNVHVPSEHFLSCTLPSVFPFALEEVIVTNPDGLSNLPITEDPSPPGVFNGWSDSFSSATINSELWTPGQDVRIENGKLVIAHQPRPQWEGLKSKLPLSGDFDIRVQYLEIDFDPICGLNAFGISVEWGTPLVFGNQGPSGAINIERRVENDVHYFSSAVGSELDSSQAGVFRIRRKNGTIFLFKSDGHTLFGTAPDISQDVFLNLYGRDDGYGCNGNALMDNLTVVQ